MSESLDVLLSAAPYAPISGKLLANHDANLVYEILVVCEILDTRIVHRPLRSYRGFHGLLVVVHRVVVHTLTHTALFGDYTRLSMLTADGVEVCTFYNPLTRVNRPPLFMDLQRMTRSTLMTR